MRPIVCNDVATLIRKQLAAPQSKSELVSATVREFEAGHATAAVMLVEAHKLQKAGCM